MGQWRCGLVVLAWAVVLCVGSVRPAQAQTQAELFDDRTLQELHLFVNSRDLAELRTRFRENVVYPADLLWRGLRVRNVGIRSRGLGSRNGVKLGLDVDVDHYTDGQQFLGLSSLVLDNLWQDAAMIREALAMSVFRRMGQAAPRESFARLFINNTYQGVYAVVEPIDAGFVSRAVNDIGGYRYEFRWLRAFFTEYLGDELEPYAAFFEPRSRERESPTNLFGPIRDLFREINGPDDAVWRERVDERMDLAQLVTYVAIEQFIAQDDGILGYDGINNFYLYRFSTSNRHRVFPWDQDRAFVRLPSSSVFQRGNQPVVVFERAMGQPDLRSLFFDIIEQCARVAAENDWLAGEIERLVALITPAALEDTRKQFKNEEFAAEVTFLREFAASRPNFVLAEIGRAPIAPAPATVGSR